MAQQALGDTLQGAGDTLQGAGMLGSLDACERGGLPWRASCALTVPLWAGGGGNTRRVAAQNASALPQAPWLFFRQKGL